MDKSRSCIRNAAIACALVAGAAACDGGPAILEPADGDPIVRRAWLDYSIPNAFVGDTVSVSVIVPALRLEAGERVEVVVAWDTSFEYLGSAADGAEAWLVFADLELREITFEFSEDGTRREKRIEATFAAVQNARTHQHFEIVREQVHQ